MCGSRNWNDKESIKDVLFCYVPKEIIEGGAKGADTLARQCAEELGVRVIEVQADWKKYGKAAGPIRNAKMLEYRPDLVVAFHDDITHSKGTKNMISQAKKANVEYIIVNSRKDSALLTSVFLTRVK